MPIGLANQGRRDVQRSFGGRAVGTCALVAGLMLAALPAWAENFHGFDPLNFNGEMLPEADLKAMAADAAAVSKPHDGKTITIGFANLQRDVVFCVKVEKGILANAKAAGIDVVVADNHLDGATALNNAESFLQRNVDAVIEFQTDANFGATIMNKMNDAGTKVTAIDIPMPGATFFGVNNPRAGFMGGSYLAQAAASKFGADKVNSGYLVVGELPQSGAIPAMRTDGQINGFMASAPGFPADHLIKIDTKNTLEESFTQMTNVLPRIPAGVPIMVTAINDQATIGMIRATKQAGRDADLVAVGLGADEGAALASEPALVASVGSFPERYGNYLVPLVLMQLAGKAPPATVLVHHVMVTKDNICKYYADQPCAHVAELAYAFPQAAFEKYLVTLRASPELKDYENLVPTN
jgi:ribose transport system substrate-binding protein